MATQAAPVQLSVLPDAKQVVLDAKQITNILEAPEKLAKAIKTLRENRASAKTELARSLSKDLAAAPFNFEQAFARYTTWKANDKSFADKIETTEKLRPIFEELIRELKATKADALKAVIQDQLAKLEREAAVEEGKADVIKHQTEAWEKLLRELKKTRSAAAARSKKK
jgi:RecA/RadA recombinase